MLRARGERPSGDGGLYFTNPKANLQFIHSGCALLDCVLGGGWPLGRISNIVGDKSSGKTLLAIEACANFQRQYPKGETVYVESEAAFDPEYASALGLGMNKVLLEREIGTVEALFSAMGDFLGVDLTKDKEEKKTKLREEPGLIVVDSLDALSDKAESERSMDEGSYGAKKARLMSELFRRLIRVLERTKTTVLIVSQVRDNIGVTFGKKHTRSGGRALDFYASIALWLAHSETVRQRINKQERATGIVIKAKCEKNKISFPYRECRLGIRFGYGVEDIEANLDFLKSIGKEGKAKPLLIYKRARGRELAELRQELAVLVSEEWYGIERKLAPERGKYQE